jgi:hypothetical protein
MSRHFCKTSTCIKGIQVVSSIDIIKSEIAPRLKRFVKNGNNMLNIIASQTGAGVTFDLTFFDNSKVIDFDD